MKRSSQKNDVDINSTQEKHKKKQNVRGKCKAHRLWQNVADVRWIHEIARQHLNKMQWKSRHSQKSHENKMQIRNYQSGKRGIFSWVGSIECWRHYKSIHTFSWKMYATQKQKISSKSYISLECEPSGVIWIEGKMLRSMHNWSELCITLKNEMIGLLSVQTHAVTGNTKRLSLILSLFVSLDVNGMLPAWSFSDVILICINHFRLSMWHLAGFLFFYSNCFTWQIPS